MNHRLLWLGLSLIVGVSGGAPRLHAQEISQRPRPNGWYGNAPLTGWSALYPRTVSNLPHYEYTPIPAPPAVGPVTNSYRALQGHLNSCGRDCQTQPFGSCGNSHDEMRFVFGTCRTFFGEPCLPNPPVVGHAGIGQSWLGHSWKR